LPPANLDIAIQHLEASLVMGLASTLAAQPFSRQDYLFAEMVKTDGKFLSIFSAMNDNEELTSCCFYLIL